MPKWGQRQWRLGALASARWESSRRSGEALAMVFGRRKRSPRTAPTTVALSLSDGSSAKISVPSPILQTPGLPPWSAAARRAGSRARRRLPFRRRRALAAPEEAEWKSPTSSMFAVVNAAVRVPAAPLRVYGLMTSSNNNKAFRNVASLLSRKVLEEDILNGTRLVAVKQRAAWRFLCFSGAFDCAVRIAESRKGLMARYTLDREDGSTSFMSHFSGQWQVLPLLCGEDKSCKLLPLSDANVLRANESLVVSYQELQPRLTPPPPFQRYVRGIAKKTLGDVLEDLQTHFAELQREKDARSPLAFLEKLKTGGAQPLS